MSDKKLPENLKALTPMEWRVLSLIAESMTSKEIAHKLFISHRTVQNHRYNIAQKLDLKGPNKLLEFAIQNREFLSESTTQKAGSVEYTAESKSPKTNSPRHIKWVLSLGILIVLAVLSALYFDWFKPLSSEPQTNQNRIAVMPFRLIGPDSSDAYLADGLTEELITQISQNSNLRVIARTSVMPYKDKRRTIDEIGRELQVQALLEGSVQKAGSQIRINVQLIDTQNKENLWGRTFDRKFSDILAVQQEIAWQVAMALKEELFLEGLEDREQIRTLDEDAYTAYLKGRYFVNRNTGESFQKAIEFYQTAIDIDSTYARAWAGLADVYTWLSNYGFMSPDSAYANSRRAAKMAIRLAPDMGEAHTAIAAVALLYDWDFQTAGLEFQKALSLNPSDVIARRLYALLQLAKGNSEKALEHTEITVKLDPLSLVSNAIHARTYYFARRYNQAIAQCKNTLEIDSGFWLVHSYLGEAYLELREYEPAIVSLQKALKLAPENAAALARLGYGYAVAGQRPEAMEILEELIDRSNSGKTLSFQIALIHTALGNHDRAFDWMQIAYENRHDFMLDLKMDPKLDPLRSDPRFNTFLLKMGLK